MVDLSDDYRYYIERAQPKVFSGLDVDWVYYAEKFNIPESALPFFTSHPSYSAFGGRLLFGEPEVFRGVLPLVFGSDCTLHHRDTIVLGQTAFSTLLCWNKDLGPIEVNLLYSTVICNGIVRPDRFKRRPDIVFYSLIDSTDPDSLDEDDENGKPLFSRAQKKLGPLTFGECYGFRLALPLGGYRTLDKLEKLSAPEHFSFLAQLQTFKLIDWGTTGDFGLRVIREIG